MKKCISCRHCSYSSVIDDPDHGSIFIGCCDVVQAFVLHFERRKLLCPHYIKGVSIGEMSKFLKNEK